MSFCRQEEIQIKDLFGAEPLGIFTDAAKLKENDDSLTTWSKLEKHEVRLHMSYAPRNYFEKMAYWTEQGKVWHFPIDNEQGMHLAAFHYHDYFIQINCLRSFE